MGNAVIYQIKNKINDDKYIGSTVHKKRRWKEHKSDLKNNRHHNRHLQNAWNKYGKENFEFLVLEKVDSENKLLDHEQSYLDTMEPEYNIAKDTEAIMRGAKHSEKAKKKQSRAMQGRKLTEEHKRKLSKAKLGEKHPMYGKHHDEETKRKISEANMGKEISEETKQKISETLRGEGSPSAKLTKKKVKIIKHLLNGDSFAQKQIAKMFGVTPMTISYIKNNKHWGHVKI